MITVLFSTVPSAKCKKLKDVIPQLFVYPQNTFLPPACPVKAADPEVPPGIRTSSPAL